MTRELFGPTVMSSREHAHTIHRWRRSTLVRSCLSRRLASALATASSRANGLRPGLASVVSALLLLGIVSGCGSNADTSADPPQPTATTTSETNHDRYEEALARFTEYEKVTEPIFARGKYTPHAREVLGEYWQTTGPDPVPATLQVVGDARLRQAAVNEIQLKGLPKVLWSKSLKVTKTQVVIEQCIDSRTQRLFQHGKRVQTNAKGPVTRRIILVRNQDQHPWLMSAVDDRPKTNKPC